MKRGMLLVTWCCLSVLAGLGCRPKPELTKEQVLADLAGETPGRIHAAGFGTASLKSAKLRKTQVRGNQAWAIVDVEAEQSFFDEKSILTARLRLSYQWQDDDWQLSRTEEVRPWAERRVPAREPPRVPDASDPDSVTIEQLRRAKRMTRRALPSPVPPW